MGKLTSGCALYERYLVVYDHTLASAAIRGQQQRLERATAALSKLAAKPGDDLEQLQHKAESILKRHRVKDLFSITTTTKTITETRYLGRGRPTANSPKEQVTRINLQLQ